MTGERATVAVLHFCADLAVDGQSLALRVTSASRSGLSVGKMALAEHLFKFAGSQMPTFSWSGDGAHQRDFPYFREMRVVDAHPVTPLMRRVVLAGDAAHFSAGGLHVRVLIPPAGRAPVWPHAAADGRTVWPSGPGALTPRVYTLRAVDPARGQVTIDVALHEGAATPGAQWAQSVCPGDCAGLLGPGGGDLVAADCYLFAGDETALPAIARMLENLPAHVRAIVRLEVANAGEEQPLATRAALDLRWLHRNGAPAGTSPLLEQAVRAVELGGQNPVGEDSVGEKPFVWIGCEQATARSLRGHLARDRKLGKERRLVAAYWRRGYQGVDLAD